MEFEFFAPDVESGLVQFHSNGINDFGTSIYVTHGRGYRTQTEKFEIRRSIPPRQYDPQLIEKLCRVAITKFLSRGKRTGNVMHSPEELDEKGLPWVGALRPYQPTM